MGRAYYFLNMKTLFFFFVFLLFACKSQPVVNGQNVIEEEKMIVLLEKVTLLEHYFQAKYGTPSVYKEALDSSVALVLKKNGVTKKEYETSFEYYTKDQVRFKKMQEKIIERLNKKHL